MRWLDTITNLMDISLFKLMSIKLVMVSNHHQLNGHQFEQTPGNSEGQGSQVCYSLWGHRESDTTLATEQHSNCYAHIQNRAQNIKNDLPLITVY